MISKHELEKSIKEIYKLFKERHVSTAFTLESINSIFEIGNEVFMRNNAEEIEKLYNRPKTDAPDLLDDEPFSFERNIKIYKKLEEHFNEISPELIQRIFELNSQLAWKDYKEKYIRYILDIYRNHSDDEYINYLAAVVLYEKKQYSEALKCINLASSENFSSASYTFIKGLCMKQLGELDIARTYFYQALFLIELMQDTPPRRKKKSRIYPNFPVEIHATVEGIRAELKQLDKTENIYQYELLPLLK